MNKPVEQPLSSELPPAKANQALAPRDNDRELRIVYRSIAKLTLRQRNPRIHSQKQIRQIADSIGMFGFTNPVLVDGESVVIAGHGRVRAAMLLGLDKVPTIRLDHMSETQIRAYVIADNKLAENAGWDRDLLAVELQYLSELNIDLDVIITGFETAEVDLLIRGLADQDADAADEVPEVDSNAPAISRPGDLWQIGRHHLLCGDATKAESFTRLMKGDSAQMVFIDPPYNVPIEGHVTGLGRAKHAEFVMASGEMTEAEFVRFLQTIFAHLAHHSIDGSIHFVFMDWRHISEVLAAAKGPYAELKNLCIWAKTNGGMGLLYRSRHELVFVFKAGTAPHINNVELGRHGRNRTNVWEYPGVNTFRSGRDAELAMHPTVKPVALVADAILDCSRRNGIVLDSFAGSGTTLLAAERSGRIGRGLEIDPRYVDVAIRRLADHAGLEVVHAETGKTFGEIAKARSAEAQPHLESDTIGLDLPREAA